MTAPRPYRYLFGPVHSRRMGLSLGIDLVRGKTCCYDCPFCQVGRTADLTLRRRAYVPTAAVLAELKDWAARGGRADFLTLAGSGEPTLHTGFGRILREGQKRLRIRTALLSNGSLFFLPEVRRAAGAADVVKASLSAWDQESFERINRPHAALHFDRIVRGLAEFRRVYEGEFWIEVFLVRGVNDDPAAVRRIARWVNPLGPDQVHLNTVARPPAEGWCVPVPRARLEELAAAFSPTAVVVASRPDGEETGCRSGRKGQMDSRADRAAVLAVLRRHPCRAADVAAGLGMDVPRVRAILSVLVRGGEAVPVRRARGVCFAATRRDPGPIR